MKPLLLAAALLPAGTVEAQSPRAMDSVFCMCPNGKRGQTSGSCEAFCGEASGGIRAPRHDPYEQQLRDQEAAERARRVREDAERAARAEKERLEEELQFRKDKREAMGRLKGVTVTEPQLKGVGGSNPHGLKGVRGGDAPALKGLAEAGEAGGTPKCRVVDDCVDALSSQAAALDAARRDKADLYVAMGSAEMKQALLELADTAVDKAGDSLVEGAEGLKKERPQYYVWRNRDRAGLPIYVREYQTSVDELFFLLGRKQGAAQDGLLDPPPRKLLRTEIAREGVDKALIRLKAAYGKLDMMHAFMLYMKALQSCAQGPDGSFDTCVRQMTNQYERLLRELPLESATRARVSAVSSAYTRYSTRALDRARDAAGEATKCFKGCR